MSKYQQGSFKDPAGHIVIQDNRVFRLLNSKGAEIWKMLASTPLTKDLQDEGLLIKSWEAQDPPFDHDGIVLEHERIPFISYPYEWPFAQLKKAAQLHIDILKKLLNQDLILKDATPFNIQFKGTQPVFIDLLSLDRHTPGDPWGGYAQFCDTMLYPLMLQAHKGIPYHEWLKGAFQGIPAEHFSSIFGITEIFKKGVLTHVKLRAALHKKLKDPDQLKRKDIQKAKLPKSAILNNLNGLESIISDLSPNKHFSSHWTSYTQTNEYEKEEMKTKKSFVSKALEQIKPSLTWDLGSNTGDFSFIASKHSKLVISMDNDNEVVEALVKRCEHDGVSNILPLVVDMSNPSPSLGWNCDERQSIFSREQPDLIIALALVHHLAVKGNVPLEEQVRLFSTLSRWSIIEYVDRSSPMFQKLITNVGDDHENYTREIFNASIEKYFTVLDKKKLTDSREIYFLESKQKRNQDKPLINKPAKLLV